MAMVEVAYELKGVADYLTACQFTMPMENILGADLWLDYMKNNQSASVEDVARKITEKVLERARAKGKTTTFSTTKLSAVADLGARIGQFGNQLSTEGAQNWNEVLEAWQGTNTSQLDDPKYCDLVEFVSLVKSKPNLQLKPTIVSAANDVLASMNLAVIYKDTYCAAAPIVTRNGLNIHFPRTMQEFDSTNYVRLEFHATNWHSFLSNFVNSIGGQGGGCPTTCATARTIAVGQTVQCSFTGADSTNWFSIPVTAGTNYRFQLCGFTAPTDYDFYIAYACNDQNWAAYSELVGCEDGNWQPAQAQLVILIHRFTGSGSYTFSVTQAGPNIVSPPLVPTCKDQHIYEGV
jgi:hypothetical protein